MSFVFEFSRAVPARKTEVGEKGDIVTVTEIIRFDDEQASNVVTNEMEMEFSHCSKAGVREKLRSIGTVISYTEELSE